MSTDTVIQIRINKELKEDMKKRSKELNMNMSSYIIYLIQKDLKKLP